MALGIEHEICMRRIVMRALSRSTIFSHIISQTARFKIEVTEHKMCALLSSTNFV